MNAAGDSRTSATLLGRLQGDDPAAWDEFVRRYAPTIHACCRRHGLQKADAEDVTQGVLLKLLRRMKTFRYDPKHRFRAWLRTVTRNALIDLLDEKRKQSGGLSDSEVVRTLAAAQVQDDVVAGVEAAYRRELLEQAEALVRPEFQEETWRAYHLLAHEGLSGQEAAARVGKSVSAVFTAKSKVLKRLAEEVTRLDAGEAS